MGHGIYDLSILVVLINGAGSPFFVLKRENWKIFTLAPLLFLLVVEYLIRALKETL